MKMKLQAPEGCGGASHNGTAVEMDENGVVDINNNPDLVAALKDHGFTDYVEPQADPDPVATKKSWSKKAAE